VARGFETPDVGELVELSPISHCSPVLEYRRRIAFKSNLVRLSNTNTNTDLKQYKMLTFHVLLYLLCRPFLIYKAALRLSGLAACIQCNRVCSLF
jgi:hypothetical protein